MDAGASPSQRLHTGDYVVFALTILISVGIGLYYALPGRRQDNTSDYLVGGRSFSFLPVTISLMVSFQSSIMMLGTPAEGYLFGLQYIWWAVGVSVTQVLAVHVVVPLLRPLAVTSVFEYLELRFQSRAIRLLGTVLGMLSYMWYMGVVLFGPAVALSAVTGQPQWITICTISVVSVVYTTIGGMRAVIWTDVFQAVIMYTGILSILIKGTMEVGGPKKVWDVAAQGGRMNFFNFDPDPRTRHTFWSLLFGAGAMGMGMGFNQSTVQRVSTTRSLKDAMRMLYMVAPLTFLLVSMSAYEGVISYSYYQTKGCDPLASNRISDFNQIIPLFAVDIFDGLPGMTGLFIAALCSASLSTLSSGLNGMSALAWADIISPLVGKVSERKATVILQITVICFGGLGCALAFAVSLIGGTITQIGMGLINSFSAPLTGVFCLACFFPRCNIKGCLIGAITATSLVVWISMGQSFSPSVRPPTPLPFASTDQCPAGQSIVNISDPTGNSSAAALLAETTTTSVFSQTSNSTSIHPPTEGHVVAGIILGPMGIEAIYTISYMWIPVIGLFGTIIFGLLASLATGMNKPGDVDPRYLISVTDSLLFFLPAPVRRYLSSIGPQFITDEYKEKFADLKTNRDSVEMSTEIATISEKSSRLDIHGGLDNINHSNGRSVSSPQLTSGIDQNEYQPQDINIGIYTKL